MACKFFLNILLLYIKDSAKVGPYKFYHIKSGPLFKIMVRSHDYFATCSGSRRHAHFSSPSHFMRTLHEAGGNTQQEIYLPPLLSQ